MRDHSWLRSPFQISKIDRTRFGSTRASLWKSQKENSSTSWLSNYVNFEVTHSGWLWCITSQPGMDALFLRFDVCRQFLPKWHIVCARRCHHNFYAKRWWLLGFYDTTPLLDEFIAHPSTNTYVVPLQLGFYETICQKSLTLLSIFIILQCSFLYGEHQRHYESPKLVFLILFCCYIRTGVYVLAGVLGREHWWLTVLTWVLGRTECTTVD